MNFKTIPIACPFFVGQLKEHQQIKDKVLNEINSMREADGIVVEEDNMSISKCDWQIEGNVMRNYIPILLKPIQNYFDELVKYANYESFRINDIWFQQYKKEDIHDWHVHMDCQWSGVYYLEMPKNAPKTEFIHPLNVEEKFTCDVQEGDIIIFPSFVIHRAPKIEEDVRKTIIAFNLNLGCGKRDYG